MTGPMEINSRRKQRLENKKKKLAAFLDIAKLNELDRQKTEHKTKMCDNIAESPHKKLKIHLDESLELGPSGKAVLHNQEFTELKKKLRERTVKIKQTPKFHLREMGENATLKIPLDSRCPLFLSDIQHLLMYSQIGVHSPYSPARWCCLQKYNRLSNVTVLIIENMALHHYELFESHFPSLNLKFTHKIEVISPFAFNNDIVRELSLIPLSMTQMRRLISEHGSLEEAAKNCSEIFDTINHFFPIMDDMAEENMVGQSKEHSLPVSDKYSRTRLLLSGWQMIDENFPLPIKGLVERKYSDYVLTKDRYKHVSSHSPMVAIDCEMCKTDTGELELTRVSAVNEKHEVLYDTLVKPENKIVDYLTRFSGINPKMMKNVTKKLSEVQTELKNLLPDDAILVGQSLSNDLHALKMMHPYIIDTSVIYNTSGDRTRKTKLQTLAREFLEEKIQEGSQGHCSSEDSRACMKLVQLKLKRHPYFGDAVMNSIYTQQRAYPDLGTANYAVSMLKQCVKAGNTVNLVGIDDLPDKYTFYLDKNSSETKGVDCTRANSNREVIEHLKETMDKYKLNIGHLRIAREQLEDENPDKLKILKLLNKWIGELYERAEQPALLAVVLSGEKDGGNGACFLELKRDFVS